MAMKESNHAVDGNTAAALNAGFREGVVEDAEELVGMPSHHSAEYAGSARKRFQQAVARAKLKLVDTRSRLTDKARQTTQTTRRYVVVHPWKSATFVASIGVVVGLFMGRRS